MMHTLKVAGVAVVVGALSLAAATAWAQGTKTEVTDVGPYHFGMTVAEAQAASPAWGTSSTVVSSLVSTEDYATTIDLTAAGLVEHARVNLHFYQGRLAMIALTLDNLGALYDAAARDVYSRMVGTYDPAMVQKHVITTDVLDHVAFIFQATDRAGNRADGIGIRRSIDLYYWTGEILRAIDAAPKPQVTF